MMLVGCRDRVKVGGEGHIPPSDERLRAEMYVRKLGLHSAKVIEHNIVTDKETVFSFDTQEAPNASNVVLHLSLDRASGTIRKLTEEEYRNRTN